MVRSRRGVGTGPYSSPCGSRKSQLIRHHAVAPATIHYRPEIDQRTAAGAKLTQFGRASIIQLTEQPPVPATVLVFAFGANSC